MRRRLFTLVAAVSLVLCVAACVLWVLPWARRFVYLPGGYSPPTSSFNADTDGLTLDIRIAEPAVLGPEGDDAAMERWTAAHRRKTFVRHRAAGVCVWRGWPVIVHLSPVGVRERTEFQGYSHGIFLPYWVAVTLTAPLPTVLILRRLRRIRQVLRRTAGGRCPDCGYDLRATPGRCPECGAVPINSPAPT